MSRKARRGIFNRGLSKYVSAQFGQAQDDSQTQPFCKAGPDMILVCSGTRVVRNLLEVLSANPFGHTSQKLTTDSLVNLVRPINGSSERQT
jgi:hypothetical protein